MPTLGLTLAALLFAPQLAVHLAGWEKQARGLTNFHAEFTVTRKDAVFGKEQRCTGIILGQPSGSVRLRMENVADKIDFEAVICDGRSAYFYNGLEKVVTEFRLPPPGASEVPIARLARKLSPPEWLMFRLLSGATAKEATTRFDVSLLKEDANYVYLDIRPRMPKDRAEFTHARVALYGPDVLPPQVPYTPAELFVVKMNGDTEHWKFSDAEVNLPGVDEKAFQFQEVPGFKLKKAPAAPPGGPTAPPGGKP
jgi:TIGR03009 family protein